MTLEEIFRKVEGFKKNYYDLFFKVDPDKEIFKSKQKISLINVSGQIVNNIFFVLNGDLIIDSLSLIDAKTNKLIGKEWEDKRWEFPEQDRVVSRIELLTTEPIIPDQELDLHIKYHMNPEAILDEPHDMYNLTISPKASYVIGPYGGHYPIVTNNLAPFQLTIKYPEGNLSCVPGILTSSKEEAGYRVDTYKCHTPNIPAFSVAPYHKIVREKRGISFEAYLYPSQSFMEEMFDTAFKVIEIYFKFFGDNGTRVYKIGTVGEINSARALGGENKGNTIYFRDRFTKQYIEEPQRRTIINANMAHEIFHNWNIFYVNFSGSLSMWWEEGGANFMAAWAIEKIFSDEAAAKVRRNYLEEYIRLKGFQAPRTLLKLDDKFGGQEERSLMYHYGAFVWEQLRQKLSDEAFFPGLGKFFRKYGFKEVKYKEFLEALQEETEFDVEEYLSQWIGHNATIDLSIEDVKIIKKGEKFITQVEVGVSLKRNIEFFTEIGYKTSQQEKIEIIKLAFTNKGRKQITIESQKEPIFIQIDPYYRVPQINLDNNIWENRK